MIPETQARLDRTDRYYTFRNPGNAPGLAALLRDLLQHLSDDGIITNTEIRQIFTDIIKTELDEDTKE